MSRENERIARARGYHLLSRMLLEGAREVPAAAVSLVVPDGTDLEELQTEYVAAFDLGVPPYASTFLDKDGLVGGAVTRNVADAIHAYGKGPVSTDVGADHLGVMLAHLGNLCRVGVESEAARFAREYLLSWLPALVASLEPLEVPLWSGVVEMALGLVCDHACEQDSGRQPIHLPVATGHPLMDDRSGLKDVATFLSRAASCGMFVTDADCAKIGRKLDLPRGFGHRRARIETMLHSAAEYGALVPLCDMLIELADHRRVHMETLVGGHFDTSLLRPWTDKLGTTQSMLEKLRHGAEAARTAGDPR